jgi:ATP-dependent Zn protease
MRRRGVSEMKSKEEVAHHEVGHTVSYWHLTGHWPASVTIVPGEDYVGLTTYSAFPASLRSGLGETEEDEDLRLSLEAAESRIVVGLAGKAAEWKINPQTQLPPDPGLDWQQCVDLAVFCGGYAEGARDVLLRLWSVAQELVADHWEMIQALAGELLEQETMKQEDLETWFDAVLRRKE